MVGNSGEEQTADKTVYIWSGALVAVHLAIVLSAESRTLGLLYYQQAAESGPRGESGIAMGRARES